jgi:hypothetical protein
MGTSVPQNGLRPGGDAFRHQWLSSVATEMPFAMESLTLNYELSNVAYKRYTYHSKEFLND